MKDSRLKMWAKEEWGRERRRGDYPHTDLALELREELGETTRFRGISMRKEKSGGGKIRETTIRVENEEGAKIIGKPPGVYITLEGENMAGNDGGFHEDLSRSLSRQLRELLEGKKRFLFAGLGNADVTPDALGPLVIKNLSVTRHLGERPCVSAIAPGVMAQTGMETGEILQGIIRRTRPDALIAIDALAAKSAQRLNRTIQICSVGIAPGSGVGNYRNEITEKTMGIPVIAIGVPTVISLPSIACDIMESFCAFMGEREAERFAAWQEGERYRFMAKILDERLWELFVTPKEIDEAVKRISYTLSEGINRFIANWDVDC